MILYDSKYILKFCWDIRRKYTGFLFLIDDRLLRWSMRSTPYIASFHTHFYHCFSFKTWCRFSWCYFEAFRVDENVVDKHIDDLLSKKETHRRLAWEWMKNLIHVIHEYCSCIHYSEWLYKILIMVISTSVSGFQDIFSLHSNMMISNLWKDSSSLKLIHQIIYVSQRLLALVTLKFEPPFFFTNKIMIKIIC